jgi:hypothetical protein
MPDDDVTVTATYVSLLYTLTVNSGSGDGSYEADAVVNISASAAGTGYQFDCWVGDTLGIADADDSTTTITMPASNAEITATYAAIVPETMHFREGGGAGYVNATFDDTYVDSYYPQEGRGTNTSLAADAARKNALLAVKGMFTELPATSGGRSIVIQSATLHLFRYNSGTSSDVIDIYRCTTDWLGDSAGANEDDCCYDYAESSSSTDWDSGSFSEDDYDTNGGCSGYWVDGYNEECELDVTDVITDIYAAGTNYGIAITTSASMAARSSEYATAGARPSLEITYYYSD